MEFSKSTVISQGQIPLPCQLCETSLEIKWKCWQCDLLMCSRCRDKVHSKFKSADEHVVKDIKEAAMGISSTNSKDLKFDLSEPKEYFTNFKPAVASISAALDDSLWISSAQRKSRFNLFSSSDALQKVKLGKSGSKVDIVSSFNLEAIEMAVTLANDLLVVTNEPRLKIIKNGTKTVKDSPYDVAPFNPLAVHATRDGRIIVTASNIMDLKDSNDITDICVLTLFDKEGNRLSCFERDRNNKPLFKFPAYITTTGNGRIFVTDLITVTSSGRIIVMDYDGKVRHIYEGNLQSDSTDDTFTPRCMTTTPSDNVVVADEFSSTLHILDSIGNFLTRYDIAQLGIYYPFSLSLTMAGQFFILYIGCDTVEGTKDKAKLYKVNLSLC